MNKQSLTLIFCLIHLSFSCHLFGADDEMITHYDTFISRSDFKNSSGKMLTKVSEVIQQDRANANRFGNPDGDQRDEYFVTSDRRAEIPRMFYNGNVAGSVLETIKNGDPISIQVVVYVDGNGVKKMNITERQIKAEDARPTRTTTPATRTAPAQKTGVSVGESVSSNRLHTWSGKVVSVNSNGTIRVRLTYVADSALSPNGWKAGMEVTLTRGEYSRGAKRSLNMLGGGR